MRGSMSSTVRVRFAPSPTGFLHVGGARTALFNWLYARHSGGKLILRIEDTDAARNTEEAVQVIYDGLRWLGIGWDEGPEVGGDFGPYRQSERYALYEKHLGVLQDRRLVYEDGGAIRFRSPRVPVTVDDLVCDLVTFERDEPDMTIRRPDGSFIFHFVNVVDDLEMGITHVFRGEDHLSNTPKHIELFRALGAEPPRYAHIPLILNPDGSKMSKRDQGASLQSYVDAGYLPEAVRNYLCLLGWSPKDDREKLPIEEVIRLFRPENLNRKNASFDLDKLNWLQGEYARELEGQRLQEFAVAALRQAGLPLDKFPTDYVAAAVETCKGKFRLASELMEYAGFYFSNEVTYQPEGVAKHFVPENREKLERVRAAFSEAPFTAESLEVALKATAQALGSKVGALVHPTRLAVTGSNSGPSLYHLLEVLGRERVLARIDRALAQPGFSG